jgi:hypothetical protein
MEKGYMLRMNDNYSYFRNLEGVKKFLVKGGVEDVLFTDEEDVIYSLENLEEIEGMQIEVTNECLCERGDEYCNFYLEEIYFED